jgi:hypothetical protein
MNAEKHNGLAAVKKREENVCSTLHAYFIMPRSLYTCSEIA